MEEQKTCLCQAKKDGPVPKDSPGDGPYKDDGPRRRVENAGNEWEDTHVNGIMNDEVGADTGDGISGNVSIPDDI